LGDNVLIVDPMAAPASINRAPIADEAAGEAPDAEADDAGPAQPKKRRRSKRAKVNA
jgi:hypothetical protein